MLTLVCCLARVSLAAASKDLAISLSALFQSGIRSPPAFSSYFYNFMANSVDLALFCLSIGENGPGCGSGGPESGRKFIVEGDEIILSAEAVGPPYLLMLSGVGPAEHLRWYSLTCS